MDYRVRDSQVWLNRTYGNFVGWEVLDEDGITGWQTIYGLRRALQAELGVSPLATAFGDVTRAAYIEHVGRIDTTVDMTSMLVSGCSTTKDSVVCPATCRQHSRASWKGTRSRTGMRLLRSPGRLRVNLEKTTRCQRPASVSKWGEPLRRTCQNSRR